jgi:hypothetical protein
MLGSLLRKRKGTLMPQVPDKFKALEELVRELNVWMKEADVTRLQVLISVMTNAEIVMYTERLKNIYKREP